MKRSRRVYFEDIIKVKGYHRSKRTFLGLPMSMDVLS